MDKTNLKHALGLLGTIAIPLLTVWADAGTDLAVKIAVTLSLAIPLVWSNPSEQTKVRTAILSGIPVATIAVSFLVARMSQGAAGGAALTVVLAALTQLQKVLGAQAGAQPEQAAPSPPTETTPVTATATPSAIEAAKKGTRP